LILWLFWRHRFQSAQAFGDEDKITVFIVRLEIFLEQQGDPRTGAEIARVGRGSFISFPDSRM
jgi:hypothetical protein